MQNDADRLRMTELKRKEEILGNILDALSSRYEGKELYERLRDDFGMTNAEIKAEGFDLQKYFIPDENLETGQGMAIKL